ncbi:ATP-binding cassette domain-containing protein [Streptococcus cuniculi]|uniref:ABC transporter ATP-binding protein n=1 Tax=Streptococcus cuniculi TaxID=1432788 RepID=A0A4Y9JEM3_9STRE|nr:ABC transporter ATP-binding protein [Streptococcus cuniculi]MBF0777618.1 ABC transporter ATP-binding protein [Streptococcus cuniculi]TFU98658.1 ABC transporter ATP-binding protein [Streptococcus cuniculi]
METLKIQALSVQIEDQVLLNNIQVSLKQGQSLVIIGESGAGKTLLTKLIMGQIPPKAQVTGSISYKGQDLLHLTIKEWQQLRGKELAYMMQNPMAMFNPFQKIKVHVLETLRSHYPWTKEECLQKAQTAMKAVRLGHVDKLLDSYPFELSGGMLQRVMLAILLSLDSDTILLDEPTSALDAYNRENVLRMLQLLQEQGKTLLTVTHDYELARQLGGQMLVMYKGVIVEAGAVTDILTHPQHPYTQELVLGNPYERLVTYED